MKINRGFTLIELLIFIVITSLFFSTGILALRTISNKLPVGHLSLLAMQAARQCVEYYNGQRFKNGYASITCPSTTVPSFCTAPTGYTLSVNVACTTIRGDANYKTITVTVSGLGNAQLTLLIAA